MELLKRIQTYISSMEEKELYRYSALFLGSIILLLGVMFFYYSRNISGLRRDLKRINSIREDEVQRILAKSEYVQKQLKDIDELLAEDKNFKISEYFENVLKKLNLTDKFTKIVPPRREMQDQYIKSILEASFDDMDMKQLTELLKELEDNRRIFVEKLEIQRSKKVPRKIEVNIMIGTFLLRSE